MSVLLLFFGVLLNSRFIRINDDRTCMTVNYKLNAVFKLIQELLTNAYNSRDIHIACKYRRMGIC